MSIKVQSSAYSKLLCKYHILFSPKFGRKVIFYNIRSSVGAILRDLCKYKNIEIIEDHLMPYHVHMSVNIPPKLSV